MKKEYASWPRFLVVTALLIGAGAFLRSRSQAEVLPPRKTVDSFPQQVGDWRGVKDFDLDLETREILGDGDFLTRLYARNPGEPDVDFFLAYFASQRTGTTIHSPQHCLPGAGWTFADHGILSLKGPRGPATVNLYVISKGLERQVVLYWYQAHGRVVPSEYWAKVYLVTDAISMNRTDGALVRVISPVLGTETLDSAKMRAMDFAEHILPVLDEYVPR